MNLNEIKHSKRKNIDYQRTPKFICTYSVSDFGIMLPLVPVVKILREKNWGHRENLGETFKGSDREKCQF